MDRIAMIDEELFVTGGDNGNLSLWTMHKKKPVFTLPLAHGLDPPLPLEEVSAEAHPDPAVIPQPQPRWITALATIPYSDVILSGSWDGFVRVWRVSDDKKKIEAVGVISTSTFTASSILSEPPVLNLNGYPAAQVNELSNNEEEPKAIVRGVINDISIFERGDRGKDGVCVVVATGKELRMGRWKKITGGRNGAVVFEISKVLKSNGVVHEEGDDDE
jgi:ribosomal RNA-processing protein 9